MLVIFTARKTDVDEHMEMTWSLDINRELYRLSFMITTAGLEQDGMTRMSGKSIQNTWWLNLATKTFSCTHLIQTNVWRVWFENMINPLWWTSERMYFLSQIIDGMKTKVSGSDFNRTLWRCNNTKNSNLDFDFLNLNKKKIPPHKNKKNKKMCEKYHKKQEVNLICTYQNWTTDFPKSQSSGHLQASMYFTLKAPRNVHKPSLMFTWIFFF